MLHKYCVVIAFEIVINSTIGGKTLDGSTRAICSIYSASLFTILIQQRSSNIDGQLVCNSSR